MSFTLRFIKCQNSKTGTPAGDVVLQCIKNIPAAVAFPIYGGVQPLFIAYHHAFADYGGTLPFGTPQGMIPARNFHVLFFHADQLLRIAYRIPEEERIFARVCQQDAGVGKKDQHVKLFQQTPALFGKIPGMVYSESSRKYNHDSPEDDEDGNIWDFIIPMGILVAVAVVTGDILTAVLLALMVCFLLYVPRKILSVDEFLNSMIRGFGEMLPTAFLLPGLCCKIEKT